MRKKTGNTIKLGDVRDVYAYRLRERQWRFFQ